MHIAVKRIADAAALDPQMSLNIDCQRLSFSHRQVHLGKWQSMAVARWAPWHSAKECKLILPVIYCSCRKDTWFVIWGGALVTLSYVGLYLLSLAVAPMFQTDSQTVQECWHPQREGMPSSFLMKTRGRNQSSQTQAHFLPHRWEHSKPSWLPLFISPLSVLRHSHFLYQD